MAKDRQTPFSLNAYLNPTLITIPQYNFRIGYFISKNYDISFGVDHMKYVVQSDQTVKISGYISSTETEYDGEYDNDDIIIEEGFLNLDALTIFLTSIKLKSISLRVSAWVL